MVPCGGFGDVNIGEGPCVGGVTGEGMGVSGTAMGDGCIIKGWVF